MGAALSDERDSRRREAAHSRRAVLVGLVICLLLVLGGLLLVYELKRTSDLQDCVMQGRSNCTPTESGN
jgi:hypothetical protein